MYNKPCAGHRGLVRGLRTLGDQFPWVCMLWLNCWHFKYWTVVKLLWESYSIVHHMTKWLKLLWNHVHSETVILCLFFFWSPKLLWSSNHYCLYFTHCQRCCRRNSLLQVNPYITRRDLRDFCSANGIVVECYSPLTKGQKLYGGCPYSCKSDARLPIAYQYMLFFFSNLSWKVCPVEILLRCLFVCDVLVMVSFIVWNVESRWLSCQHIYIHASTIDLIRKVWIVHQALSVCM